VLLKYNAQCDCSLFFEFNCYFRKRRWQQREEDRMGGFNRSMFTLMMPLMGRFKPIAKGYKAERLIRAKRGKQFFPNLGEIGNITIFYCG